MTFVNELGVEEAGIDGGGIFKDFMENITRAAFDVQYGLFKVHIHQCYVLVHGPTFLITSCGSNYFNILELYILRYSLLQHRELLMNLAVDDITSRDVWNCRRK